MNTRDPDRLGSSGTPHFATNPRGSSVMSPEIVKYQSGWWFQPTPLKKYESQLGLLFPTEWKHKKCSNPPTSNFNGLTTEPNPKKNIHYYFLRP